MTRYSSAAFDDTESTRESGGTPAPTISLFDIKRIIALRLPIFLITSVVAAVIIVPLAWFLAPVTYTATAEIRYLSTPPRILETSLSSSATTQSYDKFVNTQAAIIAGNTILNRVLNDPDVQRIPDIASADDKLQFLAKHVRARLNSGTELVTIQCTMKERDSALRILEVVVDEYLDYAYMSEATSGGDRLKVLIQERDTRQQDLKNLQEELNSRRASLGVTFDTGASPETLAASQYRESLIRAEEDLSDLQIKKADLESQIQRVRGGAGAGDGSSGADTGTALIERGVESDPRVSSLLEELAVAKSRYAATATKYLEGSPQLRKAKDEITTIEFQIQETKELVRNDFRSTKAMELSEELSRVEQQIEDAQERVTKYETTLAENEQRMVDQSSEMVKLQQLESEVAERRTLIDEISRQITDLSLESKAEAQVQKAADPSVPSSPDYGAKFAAVFLAFVAAGGFGVVVAAAQELQDTRLRSSHDIARFTNVPVLASIPHASSDRSLSEEEPLQLALGQSRSAFADQLRRIFTSVVYPTEESAWVNSLLITSPTAGDGKTTIACSLAVALAKANRRVLLVDLSHRKPDIEKRFKLQPTLGLAEVLNGTHELEDVVQETNVENLFLVGPGLDAQGLSNRLISERMIAFQARAEEAFTHVLFDAPPSLLMSDANLLAPRVDGVLLIVGVESSNRGMVVRCLSELERIGAVMLGIVLNGVQPMRGGYLKQHIDMHYHYGDPASSNGSGNGQSLKGRRLSHHSDQTGSAAPSFTSSHKAHDSGHE